MSYNSKYKGTEVEEALDSIKNKAEKVVVVDHGTGDTTLVLTPNVFHVWGEVGMLIVSLGDAEDGVMNEYLFQFTSGGSATTLSVPSSIKWVSAPNIEANKTYQVSVVNNIGLIVGV